MEKTKEKIIHIVCNIDSSYVKYCVVMLTSLFENNKGKKFHIHIIAAQLPEKTKTILKQYVQNKYHHHLNLYMVGNEQLRGLHIHGKSHISLATYLRLYLTSILSKDIQKVLYLDCDLIINGSIEELWDTDITNYAIGCVEDMWSGKEDNYQRLDYSPAYSYFNAGVLLINLDYLRKESFEEKAILYLNHNLEKLVFNDQDVLNALLHDKKLFLPHRWNIQDGFLRRKRRIRQEALPSLEQELQNPVIIHYTGSKKPWQHTSMNPYKNLYFQYLDRTEWKGERPHTPLSYRLKSSFEQLLVLSKLKRNKYIHISHNHNK